MQEEHANNVVSTLVHPTKVDQGVDTGRKGTVQPPTTLRDEFRGTLWHICLTLGGLDIRQMPLGTRFGNQLETQNTVFGQEHVLLEDVHAFDTLLTQLLGECVVTMEILLQRTAHNGPEAISGESTRKHTDITKGTFQGLVKDVTDLVLEVLGSHQRIDQVPPTFTQHGMDFTTGTAQVLVIVEGFPEGQERLVTRLGTRIQQDDHFRVKNAAKGVEQPSVRVDLLAVLLFQAEHHLHRRKGTRPVVSGSDKLLIRRYRQLSRVFELWS